MNESAAPRLELRHWDGYPPITLAWIADLGVMAWIAGGDPSMHFNHDYALVAMSDESAVELLARYGAPTQREVTAQTDGSNFEADLAWSLKELLYRCIYDFGMTAGRGGKVWFSRSRSVSLQHLHDKPNPGIRTLCSRDSECGGGEADHVWLMAQPAGLTRPFLIWHINVRNGKAVPPTPLRISE